MEQSLASVLQGLPDDARRFWTEADFRYQALRSILMAHNAGDQPLVQQCLHIVDGYVAAGMASLGFPRRNVTNLSVESLPGVAGVKTPSCHLKIGEEDLALALATSPDDLVVTWLHESVHGRHGPWSTSSLAAWRYAGYEEGLAEGLSQAIARAAGSVVPEPLYQHYIRCYELLADRLQIEHELLYRRVWSGSHARIEAHFDRVIGGIVQSRTGQPLSLIRRGKLRMAAQTLFSTDRLADLPDDVAIDREWESAL